MPQTLQDMRPAQKVPAVTAAGIDAGSRTVKVVLLDAVTLEVAASATCDQGVEQKRIADSLLERVLREAGVERSSLRHIVATGYGRDRVDAASTTVTEIACHAAGVRRLLPDVRTIIEIGGQDSKLIRLDARGNVRDFAMNDRCAAGTGQFLEMAARRLGIGLADLAELAGDATAPAPISAMCAVFAETEIVGLLASGTAPAHIVAGIEQSIARRVVGMCGGRIEAPAAFTGGVALLPGMRRALSDALDTEILVPPSPRMTGALGAALIAAREQPLLA